MLDKKAALSFEYFYWFVFILVTSAFVFIVSFVLSVYFATGVNTYNLENKIYNERVFERLSDIDYITLRHNYGVTNVELLNKTVFSNMFSKDFEKKLAFKIKINEVTAFFNKDFYDYARPLAPVRYKLFILQKPIIFSDKIVDVNIEQVFTHTLKPEQNV